MIDLEREREDALKASSLLTKRRPQIEEALQLLRPYMLEGTMENGGPARNGSDAHRMNLLFALDFPSPPPLQK